MRLLRIGNRLARIGNRLVRGLCAACCGTDLCIEYYAAAPCNPIGLCADAIYVCRQRLDAIGGPGRVFTLNLQGTPGGGGVCYSVPSGSKPLTGESIPNDAILFDGALTLRADCDDPLCSPLNSDRLVEGVPCNPAAPSIRKGAGLQGRVFMPIDVFGTYDPPRACVIRVDAVSQCWKFNCAPPYYSPGEFNALDADVIDGSDPTPYNTCCECGCTAGPGNEIEIRQCGNVIATLLCCCPVPVTDGSTGTFYSRRVQDAGVYRNDGFGCTCISHLRTTTEIIDTLQRVTVFDICAGGVVSVTNTDLGGEVGAQCPIIRRDFPCDDEANTVALTVSCTGYNLAVTARNPDPDLSLCQQFVGAETNFEIQREYVEQYTANGIDFGPCSGGCSGSGASSIRVGKFGVSQSEPLKGCAGCRNAQGLEGVRA